jgi:A/G-specific adenine glycosylase
MLPVRRHTFSHFQLDISPVYVQLGSHASVIADADRLAWYDPRWPGRLGIAAPIARIIREIGALGLPAGPGIVRTSTERGASR